MSHALLYGIIADLLQSVSTFAEHPVDIPEQSAVKGGQDLYFEVLELQPIIVSVSFVWNITTNDDSEMYVNLDRLNLPTENMFSN